MTQSYFDEEDNTAGSPYHNTPTTFTFDGLERLLSTEEVNIVNGQPERSLTRYAYDRLGNLSSLTDAQGNIGCQRTDLRQCALL